jgi:hypothetical protein
MVRPAIAVFYEIHKAAVELQKCEQKYKGTFRRENHLNLCCFALGTTTIGHQLDCETTVWHATFSKVA